MSNKTLAIIFVGLLVLFAASKMFKGNQNSSFEKIVINVDTASVDKIVIHPKPPSVPYTLELQNDGWVATQGDISSKANPATVRSMLGTLSKIEIQRLVAKSQEKWTDYEVDVDGGLRIEVYIASNKIEDFIVGRFNFDQQSRSATSYIRKTNEDDIYALDGFLSMTLNQGFDGVRDKTLIKVDQNKVSSLTIEDGLRQDQISKLENIWVKSSGERIDSTGFQNYLTSISNLNGSTIVDDINPSSLTQIGKVSIVLDDLSKQNLNIYSDQGGFVLQSDYHSEMFFTSDSSGIFKRAFTDLRDLIWSGSPSD